MSLQQRLALAIVILSASAAHGGLDNSHHDIRHYLPDKDACLICHDRRDTNTYATLSEELGNVGGQCIFLCHSGKGILPETDTLVPKPGPSVSLADYSVTEEPNYTSVYFNRSHGRWPGNLRNREGNPVAWPPPGVTWQGVAADEKLECTSCHSVHDNSYPPFLQAPLAASGTEFDGFCDRCHLERATNNLTQAPDGMHPVDFAIDNIAAATRTGHRRHARRIFLQTYGKEDGTGRVNVFDVPNPGPSALNVSGSSWNMGGHLVTGTDKPMTAWGGAGGARQQMGCYTCHSAHRTSVNGEKNLVAVRTVDAQGGWNPLCTGCHGSGRSLAQDMDEWNVGTTNFGHPVGKGTTRDKDGLYTVTTSSGFRFAIAEVRYVTRQNGNQFGSRGELLCTTCHRVHFGVPGSMGLADLGQGTKVICKSCHNGLGNPRSDARSRQPNSHHVTLTAAKFAEIKKPSLFHNPTWANLEAGVGDMDGGLDCADCHVLNGTAHNW